MAFPALTLHFRLEPRDLTLLIALYHIPIAIMTIAGGTVGDRLTHARVFTAGILLTTAALPLCGLASSYAWLLAARILQGVGAGLVFGTAPALITLAVSASHRARGLGLLNLAAGLALTVAPAAAGILIDLSGWRSVFWFRAPIALGLALFALSYRPANTHPTRTSAPSVLVPPLSVSLLVCNLTTFLANSAFIVLYVLGPLFLSGVLGASASRSGLLFMMVSLGTAVGGLVSGLFTGRPSPWLLTLFGLGLEAAGLAILSGTSNPGAESRTAFGFALAGLGIGAFQVPNMAIVMALVPSTSQGFGGGMISAMRTLGIVAGAIVSPRLFESRLILHHASATGLDTTGSTAHSASAAAAFGDVLWDATVVTLLALGLTSALAIRGRHRSVTGRRQGYTL